MVFLGQVVLRLAVFGLAVSVMRRGEQGCLGSAARVAARRARVFLAKGAAANDAAT